MTEAQEARAIEPVRVGLIGVGDISRVYLNTLARSPLVDLRAMATRHPGALATDAAARGAVACDVASLLADSAIELVVNLTPGKVHAEINGAILAAGKHVYSEKPFALSVTEAQRLADEADRRGLLIGSAPDTFYGSGQQAARRALDDGAIGKPVVGMSFLGLPGLEMFHPNPAAFYQPGGEPPFDVGPYYFIMWMHLLGPVRQVFASSAAGKAERTIMRGPAAGTSFAVEVDTTFNVILEFDQASVNLVISLDVVVPSSRPGELYGSDGALFLPDPLFFSGDPTLVRTGGERVTLPTGDLPFSKPNSRSHVGQPVADYRGVGMIDTCLAVRTGRPHRTASDFIVHGVEVMEAIARSARERAPVALSTSFVPPASIDPVDDAALIALMPSPFDDPGNSSGKPDHE